MKKLALLFVLTLSLFSLEACQSPTNKTAAKSSSINISSSTSNLLSSSASSVSTTSQSSSASSVSTTSQSSSASSVSTTSQSSTIPTLNPNWDIATMADLQRIVYFYHDITYSGDYLISISERKVVADSLPILSLVDRYNLITHNGFTSAQLQQISNYNANINLTMHQFYNKLPSIIVKEAVVTP